MSSLNKPQAEQSSSIFKLPPDPAIAVSVIIVSYNTCDITVQAVGSVLENAGDLGVEVIVIDNDSSDGSVEALRTAFPQVEVVATGLNGGYAWGNNVGMARARGRYVLVMNPDALMHAGTLDKAVSYMDEHPEIGCLGARVTFETGEQQSTLFRGLQLSTLFWGIFVPNRMLRNSRFFGDQRYAGLSRDEIQDIEVVAGCFMMVPRRVIEDVGAMDDRFFMYSEESEWCVRIGHGGYVVRYHPDISITHYGAVSTGQMSSWKTTEIAKGHILFMRFTRGPIQAWLGTILLLTGDVLRGLWFIPQYLFGNSEAAAPWRARIGFLGKAIFKPPHGQAAPPKPLPSGGTGT